LTIFSFALWFGTKRVDYIFSSRPDLVTLVAVKKINEYSICLIMVCWEIIIEDELNLIDWGRFKKGFRF
jgi:hypothetical protein